MNYLIIFFTSLLITIFFTPYLINFLIRIQIVDNPDNDRRINETAVPRMGGIIIYFTAILSIMAFYGDLNEVRYFVIASLIVLGLGIIDDLINVVWDKKFLFQSFAAIFLIYFLSPQFHSVIVFGFNLLYPFDLLILFFFIVGTINSINLMDGLDGLVSGFSLLIVSVTSLIGYYYSDKLLLILSVSLMGSLIAFLKFNAYPARIFLGDAGSQTLGFFLLSAALLVSIKVNKPILDLTFPIILLGVPIIDTLKVITIRISQRKNLFLPDKSHIHHILFGMNIRHKVTVFILQGFSFLNAAAAVYYLRSSKAVGVIAFAAISVSFLFVKKILDFIQHNFDPLYFRNLYNKIPEIFISIFLKIILPAFSVILAAVLVQLIPIKSKISDYLLILSIIFIGLLLFYSIITYNKNKTMTDIFVFVNLLLFLLISNYSDTLNSKVTFYMLITSNQLLMLIVLPILVFFLFFRERLLVSKVTFLSGMDLIIALFIVLLTVSSSLLPNSQINSINAVVFNSFLLYIFYKVIVTVKNKILIPLYYSSFILPILIFALLLLAK